MPLVKSPTNMDFITKTPKRGAVFLTSVFVTPVQIEIVMILFINHQRLLSSLPASYFLPSSCLSAHLPW